MRIWKKAGKDRENSSIWIFVFRMCLPMTLCRMCGITVYPVEKIINGTKEGGFWIFVKKSAVLFYFI